jgi:hypothetical protein
MNWHDFRFVAERWRQSAECFRRISCLGEQMGEVVAFIPKPAPDRGKDRLIQEARAIYESIFPTQAPASEQKRPKG